ncbi:hypothetical protein NKH18_05150 [Streptomyces sp. M10(2022)]
MRISLEGGEESRCTYSAQFTERGRITDDLAHEIDARASPRS